MLVVLWVLSARSAMAAPTFYLVTYGPGTEVWERFGHNAIWLVDPARGEEALYNFGFFDFEQRGFFRNFLLGRMRYYAAATDPEREFPFYRSRGRSIEYQPLHLSPAQADELAALLRRSVLPENREYLYDYFLANCSTRVRDVLDQVFDGAIRQQTDLLAATTTFRRSSLAMVQDDFLIYLGMQLGLGRNADRPVTVWDSFYLPYALRDWLPRLDGGQRRSTSGGHNRETHRTIKNGVVDDGVNDDVPIAGPVRGLSVGQSTFDEKLDAPYWVFAGLGAFSSLLIVLPWWLWRHQRPVLAWLTCRAWLLFSGVAGLLLCFLWFATDHSAAWRNENILLLNPLALLVAFSPRSRMGQWSVIGLAIASLLALAIKILPFSQFNYDLLLWLVPAQWSVLGLCLTSIFIDKPHN